MNRNILHGIASSCAAGLAVPFALAVAQPAIAQTAPANKIAGAWRAPFGTGTWTFEFKQENGVWSGRYMSSKYQKWHDLLAVKVEGDRVRFAVEATPSLDFDLKLDGNALNGDLTFGKSRKVPFVAERVS